MSPPALSGERREDWLLAAAILLGALNLRTAVASVGPLLDEVRLDLGLSVAAASMLTALPVLCFGVVAVLAPALARRFGPRVVLAGVFAGMTAGLLVRLGPSVVTLFAGTLIAGAAIAVANVLLPAMVKREFGHRIGLLMGLYVSTAVGGTSFTAAVTVPVADALGQQWRAGLGIWALPAIAAFVLWLVVAVRGRRREAYVPPVELPASLLRDSMAWQVTAFMALQSVGFFALLSWLPTLYRDQGIGAAAAGRLLSLMIVLGVPLALVLPGLLARSARQGHWSVGAMALTAAGLLGLLLAPAAQPLLWAVLLGVGIGSSFPIALTFVVLRSRDAEDAAQLSAMSQSAGYTLAAVGPFLFGVLHDLSGGWDVPILLLLVLLIPQALFGVAAGRALYVGASDMRRPPPGAA